MSGDGSDNLPGRDPAARVTADSRERRPESGREDDPNLGETLDDRYRLDDQIGFGGMGVIYRATRLADDETIVVKLMSEKRLADEASVQRFRREARTLSRLDHPNIVRIHDFGADEDVSYIVMEYVEGTRLDDFVEMHGGVDAEMFAALADQILEAVGEAHREGLVHRDIKPSNIMLTDRRQPKGVKVLDFGLAKLVSGDEDVTKQENLVGSMPFLAPEQIQGEEIDQRVDVYALGIVFYYMLTGRKPFRGTNASILYDQVNSEPPPLPLHVPDPGAIPNELFEFVRTCLEKDPQARPADAAVARDQLRTLVRETGLASRMGRSRGSMHEEAALRETTEMEAMDADEAIPPEEMSDAPPTSIIENPTEERDETEGTDGTDETTSVGDSRESWSPAAVLTTIGSLIIVAGGLVVWFGGFARTKARTAAMERPAVDDAGTTGSDASSLDPTVLAELEAIRAHLDRHQVEQAERRLKEAIAEMEDPDRYESKISEIQKQLHVAELYRSARQARQDGRYGEVQEKLERVLRLTPEHREATKLLESVRRFARIRVRSVDGVGVHVDETDLGEAPVVTWVEPGEHRVRLDRDGEDVWSRTLDVRKGERISLEPELDGEASGDADESGEDDEEAPQAAASDEEPESRTADPPEKSSGTDGEEADSNPTAERAESAEPDPTSGSSADAGTGAAAAGSPGSSSRDADFKVAPVAD